MSAARSFLRRGEPELRGLECLCLCQYAFTRGLRGLLVRNAPFLSQPRGLRLHRHTHARDTKSTFLGIRAPAGMFDFGGFGLGARSRSTGTRSRARFTASS